MLAVTTWRPGAHRPQHVVARRVDPADQLDDQIRALEDARRTSRGSRVSTPDSSGRSPVIRSIRSAWPGSSAANAAPDRAVAEQPDAEGAVSRDVTGRQVVVGLAPHDHARHRHRGRRSPAGAARRCSCWPARSRRRRWPASRPRRRGAGRAAPRRATITSPDSQCLPARWQRSVPRRERPVGDQRLVARAVEHRAQVVGHAAVDRHPGRDVALDRLDRVERDRRVGDQRAAGLEQQPLVRPEPACAASTIASTYSSIDGGCWSAV